LLEQTRYIYSGPMLLPTGAENAHRSAPPLS